MSIRFTCNQCSNFLSVPDEHADKKARCPSCQEINSIPTSTVGPAAGPGISYPDAGAEKQSDNPFEKPIAPTPAAVGSAYAQQMQPAQHGMHGHLRPHRGSLVLTMGILAWVCNFFLIPGILAWVWGQSDLKKMKAGIMDPSGYGTTQAGMIIGIISTLLIGAAVLFYIGLIIVAIVIGIAGA